MQATHSLKWTKNAKDDLLDIITRIKEDDNPNNAKKIYKKLRDKTQSSHFLPLKGRVVPELQVEGIVHYREPLANSNPTIN
ncbi:MAG: type II toxin-antitoxin system RelE/ParE family toxin [Epsilonproteobacteria bacterium]|nr:type II toxin-antitoxin system RelE/ParE family toxin [Campylobacterota bacterium]